MNFPDTILCISQFQDQLILGKYFCHHADEKELMRYTYHLDKDNFRTFDTMEEAMVMRPILYPEVNDCPLAIRTAFNFLSYGLPTVVVLDNPTHTISFSDFKRKNIPEMTRYVFIKN